MVKKIKPTQALGAAQTALEEAIEKQKRMDIQYKLNISEVVHDIKNPLGAMMGYIELLRQEIAGPIKNKTYSRFIKTLDTAAYRLMELCESLLGEYSAQRLPGKAAGKTVKEVNAGALIGEIKDLFFAQAKERGIGLKSEVDTTFPLIKAEPLDMYRVLSNLVSNAIKFTPRGGKVQIKAEFDTKDDTYIMVVRDSGVGMTRRQINELTRNTHNSTISPHGDTGTGQGLGVVNRIVKKMGGKLQITSTENRGTRITIKFPRSLISAKKK
jgi:signal transduction histidine kinase